MLMKIRKTLKRKDNQKGFTLVELIIVMAILAILAAIAVPRFGASLDKAKEQADAANQMMLEKAAEMYVLNGEVALTTDNQDITSGLETKDYVSEIPDDPNDSTQTYKVEVKKTAGTDGVTDQLSVTVSKVAKLAGD